MDTITASILPAVLASHVEPAQTVSAPVIPNVQGMDFDTRNAVLKTLANAAGMRLPTTRVPEGESLMAIGEEAKRALQCEVKALPDLMPGLEALNSALKSENARDFTVPISHVRMNPGNGGLYGEGKDPARALAYTQAGFSQISQFVKPSSIRNGFSENLTALPPALRATVFNHWASNAKVEGEHTIRTFESSNGRRIVRAVTSDRHSLTTGDDLTILEALKALPKGAKLRATRTPGGSHSEMEILWPAMERQLRVGDVAMLAIRITNSETKGKSLKVEPCLLRVLCYNFTTAWSEGLDEELTLRHVGDLSAKLPKLIKRAHETIEPFVHAFADAFANPIPAQFSRGEILAKVKGAFMLPEITVTRAGALWDADGERSAGNTLAGVVNALTRASQEQGVEAASVTERAAGKLISVGWDAILN